MDRNVLLIPWYAFLRSLMFWQATWFLFFQGQLSAAEAILLYALYDLSTTALEVPSGWMSDRVGRRFTLILAAVAGGLAMLAFVLGGTFWALALGQICFGVHAAFVSGTDSALLFESLKAANREDEIEAQQIRNWRAGFVALALSAVAGGAMAMWWERLPFLVSGLSFVALLIVAFALREPPHDKKSKSDRDILRLSSLVPAFREPVLLWLFSLSVLMYGFSHLPFVFGQPFISDALAHLGLDEQAPFVSGAVTSTMMVLSVLVSLIAPALRKRIGLASMLLIAFAIQVGLAGLLSLTNAAWAIALLFLRMVPDSLSTPFILARIQPLLDDETRATYLSLKSFLGRLMFAATLYVAAGTASDVGEMSFPEISSILGWYAVAGLVLLGVLTVLAGRAGVSKDR